MTDLAVATIGTPLGAMIAATTHAGLAVLEFADGPRSDRQLVRVERARGTTRRKVGASAVPLLEGVATWLDAYFAGCRAASAGTLDPVGTPFQERCWGWLATIPSGETRTYADAAAALGTSPRAFAAANASNPLAIVVPCHRIVGRDGSLTGYGGGIDRKAALLALESGAAGPVSTISGISSLLITESPQV